MKIKSSSKYKFLAVLLLMAVSMAFTSKVGDGTEKTAKVNLLAGDAYIMFINNLKIPLNRQGVFGDVQIGDVYQGTIDGCNFLYSGGFFLSGISNGRMWANGVASASRIQDYDAGTYEFGKNDSRNQIYVVSASDGAFAQSWEEWKQAVELGAEFYDGDGDGIYNPVDRNNNGKWDSDEDRPDLLGDQTVWCVYHDAVSPALRVFNDVDPQGIEIRQTVFAFSSRGVTGNMIFIRYNILNTGLVDDVIDSVYFGVWADPDLGDMYDDLAGCDVSLDAGFVYNDGDDSYVGANPPPCFLIDFFQGPVAYIPEVTYTDVNGDGIYEDGVDTPLDSATNVRGLVRGMEIMPGAKNLGLSSFVHYQQSDPFLGDPYTRFEARNYMLGTARLGEELDPCTWGLGAVVGGVDCSTIDNKFWYSGDPVTSVGWLNTTPTDQRQMSNTGPFQLVKDKPINIIVAYVVGRGTDALNSVTLAKENDQTAQLLFDCGFPSPPPPPPIDYSIRTGEDFIDISFKTSENINYRAIDTVLDIDKWVQGFYVSTYRTNSKAGSIEGINNLITLDQYGLNNGIEAIYRVAGNGGEDLILPSAIKRDSLILADPETGRIVLRLRNDPFTGTSFIKGKEYYFTITQYTLNHKGIVNRATDTYGPPGDYLDITGSALEEIETAIIPVTFGKDLYDPAADNSSGTQVYGTASGAVKYLVVNRDELTNDEYSVEFFSDQSAPSTQLYVPYWRLRNNTTNTVLIDSSKVYDYDTTNYAGSVTEGFLVKVKPADLDLGTPTYEPDENLWYSSFLPDESTGIYYVGKDIAEASGITVFQSKRSNVIRAVRLRKIEIRFGDQGMAYRYLNGFIGPTLLISNNYVFASGVTPLDTVGKGSPGKWDIVNDRPYGFVDVPFTAWVVDETYGEEKQLAVGFIERRGSGGSFTGNPDGNWDPGDSLKYSREAIMVFDTDYDPNGGQIEYTGGEFTVSTGTSTVWSDPIKGYTIPADAQGITETQKLIAKSPWFNSMFVISLDKEEGRFFTPGDKLILPITVYPYTDMDIYTFTTLQNDLTSDQKHALFDKVNVYPNPLYAYNPATSFTGGNPDEPWVTFSNLPEEVNVKIYTLAGRIIRTLTTSDKAAPTMPFLNWDLKNEDGLRVASGMYLAIVSAPGYGEKVLKFAVIMPQKQIQRY
ncbi:MAG: hypothetical protein MUO34_03555 [Ignavibacteriaceae bacterium]|nr:hypothetical protein [Ignavibacteriaceae bacterium]